MKTGKVIAIASFALFSREDPLTQDSKFRDVRRFGFRLDTATQWEYPSWAKFRAEAKTVNALVRSLETLLIAMSDIADDGQLDLKHYTQADQRMQQRVLDFTTGMHRPGAARFYRETKLSFIRTLNTEFTSDLNDLKPETFTRFHARLLQEVQEIRRRLRGSLNQLQQAQSPTDHFDMPTRY